jgi:hypothetical protein
MRWVGHKACSGEERRGAYRVVEGKPHGKNIWKI